METCHQRAKGKRKARGWRGKVGQAALRFCVSVFLRFCARLERGEGLTAERSDRCVDRFDQGAVTIQLEGVRAC
jgi:hypothetical protein